MYTAQCGGRERFRWRGGAAGLLLLGAVMMGCASGPAAAMFAADVRESADAPRLFDRPDEVDPAIPTPESIIGETYGDRAVRFEPMTRYLRELADASPLVTLTEYGDSHEGRTLVYLTITSRANHERLDEIRHQNARLADPRTLNGDAEAEMIIESLPAVAWMAYCIHGDELSPTDSAIEAAYQLSARTDEKARRWRDELVIHIDPLQNPDGRERYLAQIETLRGKVENPDYQAMQHAGLWSRGRGNHYLFDLNRDWLMMVHPETRGRAREILAWNPHLLVDAHEMSGLDTYLFDPPREPLNVSLSERIMQWRRAFSADQASAFDEHGWSYYTQEWYEEWYPGYTNAWANLIGAIGILYEAAGLSSAKVTQESGEVRTFRETVHQNVVSTFANLESLRTNRRSILTDYYEDRRWAVSDEGPFDETFLLPQAQDRAVRERFLDLLDRQGIEYAMACEPFEARGVEDIWGERTEMREFPAGTVIVRPNQPHRRLMRAILDFDPHMSETFVKDERTELENRRSSRIYDTTAWNLPMAYGLESAWAAAMPEVATRQAENDVEGPNDRAHDSLRVPRYGYLIDGYDSDLYQLLVVLFNHDANPRVAEKPFRIGGRDYPPGTILLRGHENPDDLHEVMQRLAHETAVAITPVDTALVEDGPDLGGRRFHLLLEPRVAIASQWPIATTSFGVTWHLFDDRLGLRVSPINIQNLRSFDLRKYNVLILPHASGALGAVLDDAALANLRSWIEAGGTLVAMGGSAALLADEKREISRVRLRRNVLRELEAYGEMIGRERDAREIEIDPEAIWRRGPMPREEEAIEDDGPQSEEDRTEPTEETDRKKGEKQDDLPSDHEARQRLDEWQRLFMPPGAIVQAHIDPRHWLTFGLGERVPVHVAGAHVLMSKHPAQTPVRLAEADHLRLSGLLWPEARQRLEHGAFATVERRGRGQVILFAADPYSRGYFEGSGRLLMNAVIFGPGAGTDQPLPW